MIVTKKPAKHQKFIEFLVHHNLSVRQFTKMLNEKGFTNYTYSSVLRKLKGETSLNYDDIVVFCEVLATNESVFF